MFVLKEVIFNLFGLAAKLDDNFKDQDNKGLSQRFNELLADDLDENELDLINYFIENLVDPTTIYEQYLIYEEYKVGLNLPIVTGNYMRRKIIPLMYHLYDIKSTIPGYEQFFSLLGFDSTTIAEGFFTDGWDNPTLTLDSPDRRMDSKGAISGFYNIALTGSLILTEALIQLIYNVIKLNEPIWATLNLLTYNGDELVVPVPSDKGSFNDSFNVSFDK